MAEVNRRYFEGLMQDRKLSLRGLAKRMSMGHSQLSLTFSGDRKLTINEAVQLSSILGVPLADIIEASGVSVRMAAEFRVPVIGAVQGDGTVLMTPEDEAERTSAPDILPPDTVAVQARTAGTSLEWLDGVVMFCRRPSSFDMASLGRLSLCKIVGGPAVLAAVRRGYREGSFNLFGPHTAESVRLESATPILVSRH